MADLLSQVNTALADRYRLERELGRGGMATVYLAQDVRHRRRVALKVLHPDLAYALGPDRFLREIEVAANLTHPHILPLHDSGEAAGLLYYVMPYVEGESLRDRLTREIQLPVDEALQIAREVADALAYAHRNGVVPCDIKPENILLSGGHALVVDFGIARALGQAGAERLTETGMAVGTAAYMSPEQASGERQVDGRSDVYSLGSVLYEMLAGEPPEQVYDRGLQLAPAHLNMREERAMVALAQGDLAQAQAVLQAAPKDVDPVKLVAYVAYVYDLVWVLDDAQQAMLVRVTPSEFPLGRGGMGPRACPNLCPAEGPDPDARVCRLGALGVGEVG